MFGRAVGDSFSLQARAAPVPIPIEPSGNFLGNDGNWSTFSVRVGNPAQSNDVLISTLSTELWAVIDFACPTGSNSDPNCPTERGGSSSGGLFDPDNSNTWNYTHAYTFAIDAQLIPQSSGQTFGGNYGYDTIGLNPVSTGTASPVLNQQIVATITDQNIWLGLLGLSPRMPNFASNNTQTSYLTSLFNQSRIPSLSYSYTAGAYYRGKTNASLTLGGYDTSRYTDPGFSVPLNGDKFHDLVIGVQDIEYSVGGGSSQSLVDNGFLAMIDSTVTPLWLPQSVCNRFASAFGLTVDSLTQLYVYPNDTVHQNNIKNNASVQFTLGESISGGSTTKISFPYSAFDYYYTNPSSTQGPRAYFPLRVAGQADLYTLGRTFLQEAVLTVDYGRGNFTVAQALPVTTSTKSNIVAISNSTTSSTSSTSSNPTSGGGGSGSGSGNSGSFVDQSSSSGGGISGGAIAGIVVGVVAGLAIIGLLAFVLLRRRKRTNGAETAPTEKHDDPNGAVPASSPPPVYTGTNDYFGQGAQKTATTATAHQLNKSMPVTPAISEPAGPPGPPAEMSAANEAAVVNNLNWQHYDHSSLYPGSNVSTPGVGSSTARAVPVELTGSIPRDMPHEMQSPPVRPHEMPSPDPSAAELASPVSSSGRISPLPTGVSALTPTTAGTAIPSALAPAPGPTSPAGSSMHRTQRSSATIPSTMHPTVHDPMPEDASQNVTAAELGSNRTTMFSDLDVSPDPEAHHEGYFSGGEGGISRNTSVGSAVAQPMTAQRAKVVHTRSPSSGEFSKIIEEGPSGSDVTPP